MNEPKFREFFNRHALRTGNALEAKSCCYFRKENPVADALMALKSVSPQETGFAKEDLSKACNDNEFILPLLETANINALEAIQKSSVSFSENFNNQIHRIGDNLARQRCCFFKGGNRLQAAAQNLPDLGDNTHYTPQQLGRAVERFPNERIGDFVLPLLQAANDNATEITQARMDFVPA